MTNASELRSSLILSNLLSSAFGLAVFGAGLLNFRYGNDALFGLFLVGASFIYFSPAMAYLESRTGFRLHFIFKILLAAFLFISIMGVGEFFDKWAMMINDLK